MLRVSQVALVERTLSAMWETRVRSLGQEDPLEEGIAIHSSIFTWRIPWTEELGRLQSMGSQRVGQDCSSRLMLHVKLRVNLRNVRSEYSLLLCDRLIFSDFQNPGLSRPSLYADSSPEKLLFSHRQRECLFHSSSKTVASAPNLLLPLCLLLFYMLASSGRLWATWRQKSHFYSMFIIVSFLLLQFLIQNVTHNTCSIIKGSYMRRRKDSFLTILAQWASDCISWIKKLCLAIWERSVSG